MSMRRLAEHPVLGEKIYRVLRQSILQGKLRAGQRLREEELARRMGITRTLLREAFRKLESEDLAVRIPRRGVVVADISEEKVGEIFAIRSVLVGLAARLAARRSHELDHKGFRRILAEPAQKAKSCDLDRVMVASRKFHRLLAKASGNTKLEEMINVLRDHIERFRRLTFPSFPMRIEETVKEHRGIYEAIAQGNEKLAEQLGREHIERSWERYIEKIH